MKKGLIFVISGPSGSGKTTLLKRVVGDAGLKHKILKSISFTTRPKRSGEKDKKDYFFISHQEFKRRLKTKKILEWTRYLGYDYGTPRDFVEAQLNKGRHIGLCLDFKGTRAIKRFYPQKTITIFVMPPSLEALRERIEKRCNRTKKEEIAKRIKFAKRELAASKKYDYRLVNKKLDESAAEMKRILLKEIAAKK